MAIRLLLSPFSKRAGYTGPGIKKRNGFTIVYYFKVATFKMEFILDSADRFTLGSKSRGRAMVAESLFPVLPGAERAPPAEGELCVSQRLGLTAFTLAPLAGRGWREAPGEGYVKTIIYTTLTLPSPASGRG
jgi:hypothetical protein